MKCCGRDHDTPFCPHCGAELKKPSELDSLLSHLDTLAKSARSAAVAYREKADDHAAVGGEKTAADCRNFAAKNDGRAEKYEAWAEGVRRLIAENEELCKAMPREEGR